MSKFLRIFAAAVALPLAFLSVNTIAAEAANPCVAPSAETTDAAPATDAVAPATDAAAPATDAAAPATDAAEGEVAANPCATPAEDAPAATEEKAANPCAAATEEKAAK